MTDQRRLHLPTRRAMLGSIVLGKTALAHSKKEVLAAVNAMESREGLTIFTWDDALDHRWRSARTHGGMTAWPAMSPDALAMCWAEEVITPKNQEGPFITVDSLKDGTRPVLLEGHIAEIFVISSGAEILVV